jgi:hypothetical protein
VQRIYADMAFVNAFYYLRRGALSFGDWEWVNLKEGLKFEILLHVDGAAGRGDVLISRVICIKQYLRAF